jgi:hypothetical protein
VWIVGLAVGYALIYWTYIEGFSYSPSVTFGSKGPVEALYVSAVSLTTVGFGEFVANSDALRLLTVVEAASGLLAITASVTYVLSVYPQVTGVRTAARSSSDLGLLDPRAVARLVTLDGTDEIARLHRALLVSHENIKRFPVLFCFRPPSEGEALVTLLRAATVTCLVLRWGIAPGKSRAAEVYGAPLQATLERIAGDYEQQYLQTIPAAGHDERGQTERLLRELRALVRAHDERLAAPQAADDTGFAPFVERIQPFLADLAREQGFAARPLARRLGGRRGRAVCQLPRLRGGLSLGDALSRRPDRGGAAEPRLAARPRLAGARTDRLAADRKILSGLRRPAG